MLRRLLPPFLVFVVSSLPLTWNLGLRYLWQDEAATAVLAERLLEHGRPLGYDGRNLVTMDRFLPVEEPLLPTGEPADAVEFFVSRGDFKADTTWIGQPWGQFVVAGASLALLGSTTLAARLPFALAGALMAAVLFAMVRRRFSSGIPALVAVALLLGNTFWLLHSRQCRYYALSSLLLLVTLAGYLRWQDGKRWGVPAFIGAGWLWFHQDFGSFWPVLGVLALDALIGTRRGRWRETGLVFGGLVLAVAPFAAYYELFGRLKETELPWSEKLWDMLFQLNQFQFPLVLVPVALWLLWLDRREETDAHGRRLVVLSLAGVGSLTVWMSGVTPFPFYRYLVPATALSVIVTAWVIVRLVRAVTPSGAPSWSAPVAVGALATLLLFTNLPCLPGSVIVPERRRLPHYMSSTVRPELAAYLSVLRGNGADPNRAAVEFLRRRLSPGDEVLCNYEDIPLMFYLPNPIRGGLGCFRVEDRTRPPRFAIMRRSVALCHTRIYNREMARHRWRPHVLDAPDIAWGNNPDPRFHHTVLTAESQPLVVYERMP